MEHEHRPRPRVRRRHVLAPLLVLSLLASLAAVMWLAGRELPRLAPVVEGFGTWGPVIYVTVCVAAAVLLVPGSVTKLAAGALFGMAEGMLWGFAGASLGAMAAFLVGRLGRRTWIEAWMRTLPRMSKFDASVADHGIRIVVLVRLSPVVPFSVINYALGLSRVKLRDYALATPAMLPSVFLYVYSGDIATEVLTGRQRAWWEWLLLVAGLGATIAVSWILGRKAKAALEHEAEEAEEAIEELEEAALLDPSGDART